MTTITYNTLTIAAVALLFISVPILNQQALTANAKGSGNIGHLYLGGLPGYPYFGGYPGYGGYPCYGGYPYITGYGGYHITTATTITTIITITTSTYATH
ncbi:MAG: hypothetical protein WCC17_14820 [Candidatus Nitrosopolaris sp.]